MILRLAVDTSVVRPSYSELVDQHFLMSSPLRINFSNRLLDQNSLDAMGFDP